MGSTDERNTTITTGMWTGAVGLGFFALVIAIVAMFVPGAKGNGSTVAAGDGSSAEPMTVEVTLSDLDISPASIDVKAGQEVILEVTNEGAMPHDVKVEGTTGSRMLEPGETETVSIGTVDASTEAWCTVPGHKEAGMVMAIEVTGVPADGAGHLVADRPANGAGTDASAAIDAAAKPAAGFTPYDPNLAPAPGGTVHDITMHATEELIEVAPGVTQMMWTFDGKVPGTILRGKVGDLFNITLVNDGKIGHSIDFHASKVAWDDEMRTIAPGESLVYQFKADFAGAFMYHCGTAPALHHIGNGMYGAIIIDPPDLPPVDRELVIVQSELYLGPEGKEGDLTKMQQDEWDAVVFNGYFNQYVHAPIRVEANQRIRVWVVDDGPSENSAFHVVGTVFDTVWKEGSYLLRPDQRRGGSQVLDLQPAQGGFVEFTLAEEGFYPFVTHKFSNASNGGMGLLQAGDVTLRTGAGH